RGDHHNPRLRAGKLGDEVVDREIALWSCGRKVVVVDRRALQVSDKIGFQSLVRFAADGTRPEGNHFAHVLHGARRIHTWQVVPGRFNLDRERRWIRRGSLSCRRSLWKTPQTFED